jgi:hypothetical protein
MAAASGTVNCEDLRVDRRKRRRGSARPPKTACATDPPGIAPRAMTSCATAARLSDAARAAAADGRTAGSSGGPRSRSPSVTAESVSIGPADNSAAASRCAGCCGAPSLTGKKESASSRRQPRSSGTRPSVAAGVRTRSPRSGSAGRTGIIARLIEYLALSTAEIHAYGKCSQPSQLPFDRR